MSEGGGSGGVLRELLAVFGFDVDTKELEKGESKLDEFFEKVKHIGEGIAAAFAVDQLFEFAEGQAHAMTAVEHMAARIGISTEEVQAWGYAAKASGFEAEKFTTAMSRLQVAAGSAQGVKSFKELGISVKDSSGHAKDATALFTEVAEAVKNTEDPNKRAAIATKLFGRSGRELLPFLAEGKEGIEELLGAYKELGGAYTEEDIARTKKFEKSQASLGLVWTSLKATIARVLIPVFTKLMNMVTPLVKGFVELAKKSNIVEAALITFGVAAAAFAAHLAIAAAPILAIVAAIGLLVLAVDEVITFLKGGDTYIGDAIDKMFGKGASVEVVNSLKKAWEGVKDAFVGMWHAVKQVWDFFKWIIDNAGKLGEALGDAFGRVRVAYAPGGGGTEKLLQEAAGYHQGGPAAEPLPGLNPLGPFAPSAVGFSGIVGMPGAPGAPGGSGGDTHVSVKVGIDGRQLEHTVHTTIDRRNREHMDRLPRSPQP